MAATVGAQSAAIETMMRECAAMAARAAASWEQRRKLPPPSTTLLVENLPEGCPLNSLQMLFSQFPGALLVLCIKGLGLTFVVQV